MVGQSMEALAWSLEERSILEGELDQLCNIAQVVVAEVFRLGPSTSMPTIQLAEVPNEVRALISDGIFYGTSGVLTSVVTHYPDLDFTATCRGYASGWSADEIQALGGKLGVARIGGCRVGHHMVGDGGSSLDCGRRCMLGRHRPACHGQGQVKGERRPTHNRAKHRFDRSQAECHRPDHSRAAFIFTGHTVHRYYRRTTIKLYKSS